MIIIRNHLFNTPPKITHISWHQPLILGQSNSLEILIEDREEGTDKLNVSLEFENNLLTQQSVDKFSDYPKNRFTFKFLPTQTGSDKNIVLHCTDGKHGLSKKIPFTVKLPPPKINDVKCNRPLTLGNVSVLEVSLTKHQQEMPSDILVFLEAENNLISVLSAKREIVSDNLITCKFEIMPNHVGNEKEIRIHYGGSNDDIKMSPYSYKARIDMPAFFNEEGSTFLEMIESPDDSIYGSHITKWGNDSNYVLVTGHAASNVCRKVSASLFNYALHLGKIDSSFFLGAGFGSIFQDDMQRIKLRMSLDQLMPFQKTYNYLQRNLFWNNNEVIRLLIMLRDQIQFNQEYETLIQNFSKLMNTNPDKLSEEQLEFMKEILNEPDKAAHIMIQAKLKEFEPFLEELSGQSQAVENIEGLLSFFESQEIFSGSLNALERETGLLKIAKDASPNKMRNEMINERLITWIASSHSNAASLNDILSSVEMNGISDVVMLPYYLDTTREELVFSIPQEAFDSVNGTNARNFFAKTVISEMKKDLQGAINRLENIRKDVFANIQDIQSNIKIFSTLTELHQWLNKKSSITFQYRDELGYEVGSKKERILSNKDYFQDRLAYAERLRTHIASYKYAVEKLDKQSDNPKLQQIQEYCLLDSFLRKWDLAFADNALSSPYHKWLDEKRNVVWSTMLEQARSMGINILPIVTESTVFQVRKEDAYYTVKPLFVAQIKEITVINSENSELVYYETPWNKRKFIYLSEDTVGKRVWEHSQTKDLEDGQKLVADHFYNEGDIKKSLLIAPEFTASKLVEELWDSWTDEWITEDEREHFKSVALADITNLNPYDTRLKSGAWIFPDHYLVFSLQLEKNIGNLIQRIKNIEQEIDKVGLTKIHEEIQSLKDRINILKQEIDQDNIPNKFKIIPNFGKKEPSDSEQLLSTFRRTENFLPTSKKEFELMGLQTQFGNSLLSDDYGKNYTEQIQSLKKRIDTPQQVIAMDNLLLFKEDQREINERLREIILKNQQKEKYNTPLKTNDRREKPFTSIKIFGKEIEVNKLQTRLEELESKARKYNTEELKERVENYSELKNTLIENGKKIDKDYIENGVQRGWTRRSDKLEKYLLLKRSHEILNTCICLAETLCEIEKDELGETDIKSKFENCLNSTLEFSLPETLYNETMITKQEFMKKSWADDSVARMFARQNVESIIEKLASAPSINNVYDYYEVRPTKSLLDLIVRMEWYSGKYKSAFDLSLNEIHEHSKTVETKKIATLIKQHETGILKALIYSGGHMHGFGSVFGKKSSDWSRMPESLDQIPIGVSPVHRSYTKSEPIPLISSAQLKDEEENEILAHMPKGQDQGTYSFRNNGISKNIL